MSHTTQHPEYVRAAAEWRLVDDALGGEAAVKRKQEAYLPKSAGMMNAESRQTDINRIYHAYVQRGQYPEWVRDSLRAVAGVAAKVKTAAKLEHAKLKGMAFNATADGFPLAQLFYRTVNNVTAKGRYGLLCDIDAQGNPVVACYTAENIINWKTAKSGNGRSDVSLLVLREEVQRPDDVYGHQTDFEYLVYRLIDGQCFFRRFGSRGALTELVPLMTAGGVPLDFIPFVFCGSTDNAPDVDLVPLLTMARSALKYYQLSADYFQELHLTAHPQPVVVGQDLETAEMVTGPMLSWVLPQPGANAFYLEIGGNGIEAKRVAMEAQKNAALEAGARVMDVGGTESGEARLARQNDQYATIQSIVKNAADAVRQCLRYLGEWYGLSEEEAADRLDFTVDLDFNRFVDTAVLAQLFSAAQMGSISPETVWGYLQSGRIPEHDWHDEQARILSAGLGGNEAEPGGL